MNSGNVVAKDMPRLRLAFGGAELRLSPALYKRSHIEASRISPPMRELHRTITIHVGHSTPVPATVACLIIVFGEYQDNLIAIVHTTTPPFSCLSSHIEASRISPTMRELHRTITIHVGPSTPVPATVACLIIVFGEYQDNLIAIVHTTTPPFSCLSSHIEASRIS